ncbi:MAG: TonB-dependent receptor [Rikenellaceae bacterium]|jgi:TonB-linked SusC/RagA family outer membrane protein|nr:TonB-dependent receptor [Rikenellaceae bacterium]
MKRILTILLCCVSVAVSAQVRTIQGTATSGADGSPVGGVVVTVAGSNASAITDAQGLYSIKAQTGDILAFQMLGFDRTEVAVGESNVLNVVLTPEVTTLDELVVIGYGTQQKKLITGATVQVDGEDIAKLNTVNVLGALQSQTPGVNIIQNSGIPGQGYKINIRGLGTTGNSTPLFVIDGSPAGNDSGVMDQLNPADIESIDVLKDAASAAIYGSRAANGVILITTKHGKAGQKAQVSFDAYYGIQNVYRMPQMLNAQEYMTIINEGNVLDGKDIYDFSTKAYGNDPEGHYQQIMDGKWNGTDWVEESRNANAPIQNYAVNITGGSDAGTYAMGFSYTSQDGILGKPVAPSYQRYTGRINSQYTIVKGRSFDILKVGENLTYNHSITPGGMRNGGMYWNDIRSMMTTSPLLPMYDETGAYHYAIPWNGNEGNPIAQMEYSQQSISRGHNLRSNVFLEFQPIKNLVFRSNFGYSVWANSYRHFEPAYNLSTTQQRNVEGLMQNMSVGAGLSWENTVNYTFSINDKHNFTALLGQSIEKSGGPMGEFLQANSTNPQFSGLKYAYIDNAPLTGAEENGRGFNGNPNGMFRMASVFGRVSYDYMNKYMVTVVLRGDASSNFARGHRWGYFPSVSAGWVVTEEDFMQGTKNWMDFLKVRASWGQNGNQAVNAFQYLSTIANTARYVFGPQSGSSAPSTGYFPSNLANPEVGWETSEQIDLGIDASFLRNRLGFTFDYFIKNTKDWLVDAPQPASFGTGAPVINGGGVRNSGVELAFNWNDRVGEFTYGANLNLSFLKNKVVEIGNAQGVIQGPASVLYQGQDIFFRAEEGFPIGYFYGYQTKGIFQTQEEIDAYTGAKLDGTRPGDVIWLDRNGDGIINTNDKGYLGKPNPDVRLGFGLNLGYKGFDLSMNVIGVFGNQIARAWRSWGDSATQNYTSDIMGHWHGAGTSNRMPRLSTAPHTNTLYFSDLHIEDGDFVRIQNLTLGYDLERVIKSGFLSQARVYVTAQNLLTITGYSGMDPEVGSSTEQNNRNAYGWASGIDIGYYPNPRTFLLGINLKF